LGLRQRLLRGELLVSAHGIVAISPPSLAENRCAALPDAIGVPMLQDHDFMRILPFSAAIGAPKPRTTIHHGAIPLDASGVSPPQGGTRQAVVEILPKVIRANRRQSSQ
jgi:hypothetical protein